MKKILAAGILLSTTVANAGWFAQSSESYLIGVRNVGWGNYQCAYKTNPGNRGWRQFNVTFQGGCPRVVYFNAQNGNVTVPN